jgi:anti-sigma factor RsiW
MSRTTGKTNPSDLELMLYTDGELDAGRRAEVEAYLARSAAASSKLAALGMASSIVRDVALSAGAKADGIADAVMAQIASESSLRVEPPAPSTKAAPDRAIGRLPERRGKPANDNSRGIFMLAAFAVAAAAGLMLWSRADPQAPTHANEARESATQEAAPLAPNTPAELPSQKTDKDDDLAVEVAAVDFGALTGTIFYVPTGAAASNATTTVVWLNDESAGEQ